MVELANTKNKDFYLAFIEMLRGYFFRKAVGDGDVFLIRDLRDKFFVWAAKNSPEIVAYLDEREGDLATIFNDAIRTINANCHDVGFRFSKEEGKPNGRKLVYHSVPQTFAVELDKPSIQTIDEKLEAIARLVGEIRRAREEERASVLT